MRKYLVLMLSAVTAFSYSSAYAGERVPIKGTYTGIDKSQVLELGKNHKIISIVNEGLGYVLEAPADATPLHLSAGPCGGVVEIKDGRGVGTGYCVRTNPAGGKWIVKWEIDPDISKGRTGKWEATGIEGNALDWKGGGTYGPVINTIPGKFAVPFVGWLEKP